ncbi:HAD family hydrolase [Halobacteriales archaeon QS_9_67_17]|nr:MAG: HAD family hydrolase [Halobacteriales archaeon QS_9_67_17]
MRVDAVGFDLDATLARTERSRAAILAAATDRVGAARITRAEYLAAHDEHSGGDTREPVFAALLDDRETNVNPAILAEAYREALADTFAPVGDVLSLLGDLRDQYRVGLLTDGPVATQRDKLDRLGWEELFDATVVTGALPAPKPDERAFDALVAGLDTAAESVVYVGDHPQKDIVGARDAGLVPVQVRYDDGPDTHPAAATAVRRDRLVDELPSVLAGLDDE